MSPIKAIVGWPTLPPVGKFKIEELINQCNGLPRLIGYEYRFIRCEMNLTQKELIIQSNRRAKSIISLFETYNNGRNLVRTFWVMLLRDINPEIFWEAYSRWTDKSQNERKEIINRIYNKVYYFKYNK